MCIFWHFIIISLLSKKKEYRKKCKKRIANGCCGINGIIRSIVGRSSDVVLANIDLLFRRPTNFVSSGPGYNFVCVGG